MELKELLEKVSKGLSDLSVLVTDYLSKMESAGEPKEVKEEQEEQVTGEELEREIFEEEGEEEKSEKVEKADNDEEEEETEEEKEEEEEEEETEETEKSEMDIEKAMDFIDKFIDEILKAKDGDSCRERYISPEGHFKGRAGTGERFENCVKYFMNCRGLSRERAEALCAWIGRRKYGKKGMAQLSAEGRKSESAIEVEKSEKKEEPKTETKTEEKKVELKDTATKEKTEVVTPAPPSPAVAPQLEEEDDIRLILEGRIKSYEWFRKAKEKFLR